MIIKELEIMKQYLANNSNSQSLKDVIGFPFKYSEDEFIQNSETNVKLLISMITEFQSWIMKKLYLLSSFRLRNLKNKVYVKGSNI